MPIHLPTPEDLAKKVQQNLIEEEDKQVAESRVLLEQVKALLAEDDPINQQVAKRFLFNLGIPLVDVAPDGAEAVKMYQKGKYNFIIMDCQMPNMDGLEATKKIRQLEAETGGHIPIVAATANVMAGDRERCLQAGMDDYMGKPLTLQKLKSVLRQYIDFGEEPQKEIQEAEKQSQNQMVNLEHLNAVTGGEKETEYFLTELYFKTVADVLAGLKMEVATENPTEEQQEKWRNLAHKLKGASGNFGAQKVYKACQMSEALKAAPVIKKREALKEIVQELHNLRQFFIHRHQVTEETFKFD